jgi:hypothetical protein
MPEKKKTKTVKVEDVNPQVKDMKIGVRSLRKINVYPLSVADQLEMTDMITEAVGAFFALDAEGKVSEGPPVEFVAFMFELIKGNLGDIITKVTGEEDSDAVLKDMTNDQLSEMVGIVYKENFEGPLAKIVDLFQKENEETMTSLILEKLQASSAGSTEDTDSKISSEEVTGKEALH